MNKCKILYKEKLLYVCRAEDSCCVTCPELPPKKGVRILHYLNEAST